MFSGLYLSLGVVSLNPAIFVPIIMLWVIIFILFISRRKVIVLRKIIKKRKIGGNSNMKELATKFIGKDCLIYSFDGGRQYEGVIKEVTDGALLLEKDGKVEAINLDFISRIREYPINKKGKKKSVVLD